MIQYRLVSGNQKSFTDELNQAIEDDWFLRSERNIVQTWVDPRIEGGNIQLGGMMFSVLLERAVSSSSDAKKNDPQSKSLERRMDGVSFRGEF